MRRLHIPSKYSYNQSESGDARRDLSMIQECSPVSSFYSKNVTIWLLHQTYNQAQQNHHICTNYTYIVGYSSILIFMVLKKTSAFCKLSIDEVMLAKLMCEL